MAARKPKPLDPAHVARQTVTFSQRAWRAQLTRSLVDAGIEFDLAGIVATRTVQSMVDRLRSGSDSDSDIDPSL